MGGHDQSIQLSNRHVLNMSMDDAKVKSQILVMRRLTKSVFLATGSKTPVKVIHLSPYHDEGKGVSYLVLEISDKHSMFSPDIKLFIGTARMKITREMGILHVTIWLQAWEEAKYDFNTTLQKFAEAYPDLWNKIYSLFNLETLGIPDNFKKYYWVIEHW